MPSSNFLRCPSSATPCATNRICFLVFFASFSSSARRYSSTRSHATIARRQRPPHTQARHAARLYTPRPQVPACPHAPHLRSPLSLPSRGQAAAVSPASSDCGCTLGGDDSGGAKSPVGDPTCGIDGMIAGSFSCPCPPPCGRRRIRHLRVGRGVSDLPLPHQVHACDRRRTARFD